MSIPATPLESCTKCNSGASIELCAKCKELTCSACLILSSFFRSHQSGPGYYSLCTRCSSQISELDTFMKTEKLSWAKLSQRGSNWLSISGAKDWSLSIKLSIKAYEDMKISEDDQLIIDKDVNAGRTDPHIFDWELKEILMEIAGNEYREDICKILRAFCARNRKIGYCQGMSLIAVWLLIFLDHEGAFILLCFLVEKCLPKDFYIGGSHGNALNGFYVESTVVASLIEKLLPSIVRLTLPTNEFTDFFCLQHLVQLFINTIDLQSTLFLWEKIFTDGSVAITRGAVSLILISDKAIKKDVHPLMILKIIRGQQICTQLISLYSDLSLSMSPSQVEKLRKKAKALRAREWTDCKNVIITKLENISGFSPEEIQSLQSKFKEFIGNFQDIDPERRRVSRRRSTTLDLPKDLQQKMDDYRGSISIGIKKTEFLQLLNEIAPHMIPSGETIFDTYDEDQSGYLDFRELVIAMSSISKGSFEEKLEICFNAYDSEKCGYLNSIEIQLLIQRILEPYVVAIEQNPQNKDLYAKILRIHEKMMNLSENSNSKLAFFDLLNGIKADLFLFNCFSEFFRVEYTSQVSKICTALSIKSNSMSKAEDLDSETKCRMCFIL